MKKILFVNASLTAGGSEKVMSIIANEFSRAKYDVTMLLVKPEDVENYYIEPEIKKIKIHHKYNFKLYRLYDRARKIRKLIKQNKYDYVISFMYDINTSVLLSSLGTQVPVIVSERCDPSSRKVNKIVRFIEDSLYRRASTIVLQTEQVKKQYPKYLQDKFVVISNPLSDNIISPYKMDRKHKIVAAGRFVEQKNFKMLIDAFYEISKIYKDYKLYIYGEGPLRDEYEKQIKDLNLEKKVFLPGYVDNVNEMMNDAKIYVSTSNYEGISNSMLEALAMGVPTICTDCPVGGAAIAIKDHQNGILIPVGDCEKLIESMKEIIDDNKLETKLSKNAIKIKDELNSTKIFKEWEKLLK